MAGNLVQRWARGRGAANPQAQHHGTWYEILKIKKRQRGGGVPRCGVNDCVGHRWPTQRYKSDSFLISQSCQQKRTLYPSALGHLSMNLRNLGTGGIFRVQESLNLPFLAQQNPRHFLNMCEQITQGWHGCSCETVDSYCYFRGDFAGASTSNLVGTPLSATGTLRTRKHDFSASATSMGNQLSLAKSFATVQKSKGTA